MGLQILVVFHKKNPYNLAATGHSQLFGGNLPYVFGDFGRNGERHSSRVHVPCALARTTNSSNVDGIGFPSHARGLRFL